MYALGDVQFALTKASASGITLGMPIRRIQLSFLNDR